MDKVFKSQKRLKKYNVKRFTACLLAVLMLFSALLTGSMTVHAEATDENVVKMPVYKNATEYEEANITMQQSPIEIGDNSFELIFRPYFGTSEMNALLAANGDAAQVSIGIRLEWTDAEGPQSEDLWYKENMVKEVYAEKMAFRVIATGIKSFENLTVTPLVKSQVFTSIECLGETEKVTGSSDEAATIVLKKYGDTEGTTAVTGTGTVAIEAENVIVDSAVVLKKRQNGVASGDLYAKISVAGTAHPDATTEPDMGFEIIPDKDGTYHIWARVYRETDKSTSSRAVYVSWADGAYSSVSLSGLGATQLREFTWVKLDSKEVKANESLSVRFAAHQNNLWFDKFIVTTDETYTPTGTGDLTAGE